MTVHDPTFPNPGIQRGGWMMPASGVRALRREEPSLLSSGSFSQPDYLVDSAWLEHAPFMSWLFEALAPGRFVELGCHSGFSYFVACQAVKRLALCTECYAVDTWVGDEHAGYYGEEIYDAVRSYNADRYAAFSQLIRADFNEAVSLFADESIDLLHVDGRHYYEDVQEDVAAWRPKLAADAIVLLHDTNVRGRDFGVWKLFDELRQSYPVYEFPHGHGLGVVAFGRIPDALEPLFDLSAERSGYVRLAYATLGRAITDRMAITRLSAENSLREAEHGSAMKAQVEAGLAERQAVEQQLALATARLAALESEARAGIADRRALDQQLALATAQIAEMEAAALARDRDVDALRGEGATLSATISILKGRLAARAGELEELSFAYHRQAAAIERQLQARRARIAGLETEIEGALREIALQRQGNAALNAEIDRLNGALVNAEREAAGLRTSRAELRRWVDGLRANHAELCGRLAQARAGQDRAEAQLWVQHATVERMKSAAADAQASLDGARWEILALKKEAATLRGSASWRITEPFRDLYRAHPRAMRTAYSAARFCWLAAQFRFAVIRDRFRARAQLRRDELLLASDPMFDRDHYERRVPDVAKSGFSHIRHYLVRGRFEGVSPHPLFDASWYATEYPDIGTEAPLVHYVRHGRASGCNPNAWFQADWYLQRYPDVAQTRLDPVTHYHDVGAMSGFNPSPAFNTRFYHAHHPDVAAAGLNPLAHYLAHGRREGRNHKGYDVDDGFSSSVLDTPLQCRKRPARRAEMALFVTHAPHGRLQAHVRHHLEALVREGIGITLIVAADLGFDACDDGLLDLVDGLYVRGNAGWDFAAWAHVMRLNRGLFNADILYWINDSIIGPVNARDFHVLISRVRDNPADVVGLTANHERGLHLQSYFLAFRRPVLHGTVFRDFVEGIRCFADKDDAINAYEITLSPRLIAAGFSAAPLFPPSGEHNPTIYEWKALLDRGFPFLKVLAITNDIRHVDKSDWRETLHRHGYDVVVVDQLLAERRISPVGDAAFAAHRSVSPETPPKLAFIGPFNYANGLGVAGRGYLSALMHLRYPVSTMPLRRPFHIHRRVAPELRTVEFAGPPDVAIVHLNPDSWAPLLDDDHCETIDAARCRIGAFVWESQDPPPFLAERARDLNGIWAPSRYCAAGFERAVGIPVHLVHYPVPVRLAFPDAVRVAKARADIGIAPDHRIILYSFDSSSYLVRKNPEALVRAFDRSGLCADGWRLVLKTKHLSGAGSVGAALTSAVAGCAGAVLVDRAMGSAAAGALMDAADIYVSPHAAEGFGLTIAEAMARAKPVIATDYGGSTDFLDRSCGFPVPADLWQLDHDVGPYGSGAIWARVDEDALTETLVAVANLTPVERAQIGRRAQDRVDAMLSPAAIAAEMRASIDSLLAR